MEENNNILNETINEVETTNTDEFYVPDTTEDLNYPVDTKLTAGEKAVVALSLGAIVYAGYSIGKAVCKGGKKLKTKLDERKAEKSKQNATIETTEGEVVGKTTANVEEPKPEDTKNKNVKK